MHHSVQGAYWTPPSFQIMVLDKNSKESNLYPKYGLCKQKMKHKQQIKQLSFILSTCKTTYLESCSPSSNFFSLYCQHLLREREDDDTMSPDIKLIKS